MGLSGKLQVLVGATLLAAAILASSAFETGGASLARGVSVAIVADPDAYLAVAANPASPHDCFVSTGASGVLVLTFGTTSADCGANGGGSGINPGDGTEAGRYSRYAFHDLLLVTNKGTKDILVWTNATTSSTGGSLVEITQKSISGTMTGPDYATSSATSVGLAPGQSLYVGVRVTSGTLTAGTPVEGAVTIEARLKPSV